MYKFDASISRSSDSSKDKIVSLNVIHNNIEQKITFFSEEEVIHTIELLEIARSMLNREG